MEALAAAELRALDLAPGVSTPGGVPFTATDAGLFAANLRLRTASRVLVRAAEFKATAFRELERLARGVRWEQFVASGASVRLRVTCHKSRLYHSDAVAERVAAAIARRVPGVTIAGAAPEQEDETAAEISQLFVVRFQHDMCTISADSSGELLHRRSYRLATAKAPLRETLAAGVLMALEWVGREPLLDPMCGAGTIPIEAALVARRIAPGIARKFSCEAWPDAPVAEFAALRAAARAAERPAAPSPILASDRDAGAIAAARANAERAGVLADIEFRECALSGVEPPPGPGLLVTNPPYGARVGVGRDLRGLYAQLGKMARATCPGWRLALLSADRKLEAQVGLPLTSALRFQNGGIPVRLLAAQVPLP
jgi:putative N6-adenine-specific DNA methylase